MKEWSICELNPNELNSEPLENETQQTIYFQKS